MEDKKTFEGSRRLSPTARRVVTAALVAATIGAPTVALAAEPAANSQAPASAETPSQPQGTTTGDTTQDGTTKGAFTANGQSFDSFDKALAAASKADDKTVTITQSTTDNLNVGRAYEGVTVTAAEGVEVRGALTIGAKDVAVKNVHFIIDDQGSNSLSVKANNGTKVTGCTFDITGTRSGQFNGIWAASVTDVTFMGNTFNIAVNVNDNSWVGINLVGKGIKNVEIDGNTLNGLAPVNDTWNGTYTNKKGETVQKAPNLFLVIANGNGGSEGTYGIESFTATGNVSHDNTGVKKPNTLVYGISFNNVKNAEFTDNSFEGYMGFAYTGWPNQPSSQDVTISNNKLDTTVGIRLRDQDVQAGELTVKNNEFGENNQIPFSGNGATTAVAVTDQDGKTYSSVDKAIESGATTVTLLQNVAEDVVIPANVSVTLDLAGHTLTNKAGHTITNNGTLTVKDSSAEKTGAVDNVTHQKAAISNEEGATAKLEGGTFKRSAETGTKDNTFYTLLNHGDMTINEGTTVLLLKSDGSHASYSSLIDNGWYSGKPANGKNATLTINGGTFEGGNYIKNDSYGELTINGGTFKGTSAAVFNWNKTAINGGDFSATKDKGIVIWNGGGSVDQDTDGANVGQLTIAGGTFAAADGQTALGQHTGALTEGQENKVEVKVSGGTFKGALAEDLVNAQISGGTFTVKPKAEYVVEGSGLTTNEDGTFGVKKASLVFSDAVKGGIFTYNVANGGKVTKDDLLKLVSVNAEGYVVDVDTANLDALNDAIAKRDISKSFSFEYTATKDGNEADKLTAKVTYKLYYSSGNGGGGSVTPAPSKYDVTVNKADNGTVTADKASAAKGEKVTVTAAPADGYRVSGVTVTDASGNAVEVAAGSDGTYTFEMPASDVTVSATFESLARRFSDADYSMWYGSALDFVSARGIMGGYPNGTFGVGKSLTRYELAQLLYKYSGGTDDPAASNATGMADVADGQWYTAAANWAVKNGVVNGYPQADGSRAFGGDRPVSTEELVAIVGNLVKADFSKADPSVLDGFRDPEAVDGWARQAVAWAVQSGLINGSVEADGTYIRPTGDVARERVAAIVMNAINRGVLK